MSPASLAMAAAAGRSPAMNTSPAPTQDGRRMSEIPATDAGTSRMATGTRHGHARQPLKAVRLPFPAQVFSQLGLKLVYPALPERLPPRQGFAQLSLDVPGSDGLTLCLRHQLNHCCHPALGHGFAVGPLRGRPACSSLRFPSRDLRGNQHNSRLFIDSYVGKPLVVCGRNVMVERDAGPTPEQINAGPLQAEI